MGRLLAKAPLPRATQGLPVNPDNSDIDALLRDAQEASHTLGLEVID